MKHVSIEQISENSLMVKAHSKNINAACISLQQLSQILYDRFPNIITEQVPAYNQLLIRYKNITASKLIGLIEHCAYLSSNTDTALTAKLHHIPVCYDLSFGLDLQSLAKLHALSITELVALHSEQEYQVYALGFAPGFAYLGEVNPKIASLRHATPRAHVPAGSVGIADRQTAIYPNSSPGGWQIIGRSPSIMFNINQVPPCPIRVGDSVHFNAISLAEFTEIEHLNVTNIQSRVGLHAN